METQRRSVKVGLMGFGTVGSGTARLLLEESDSIAARTGISLHLARICDRDVTTYRGFSVPSGVLTTDIHDILDDPDIEIFIELIGGIEPAKGFILSAIERGKHVVTANKALLATHGREIFDAAAEKGVVVGFEASVGGGIPVIKAVREGLVANRLHTLVGIMNGTCNYILSRMSDEGLSFTEALLKAQALGYAEADPTYDVAGIDTAHKLAILSSLAFGVPVGLGDISVEGITKISPVDIEFAREFGYAIKLLAIARNGEAGTELRVHPAMVRQDHLLAQVKGAYNAFYLVGDAVGKVILSGLGAGQMPTGSAVVADLVDIARVVAHGSFSPAFGGLSSGAGGRLRLVPVEDLHGRYYMRFSAIDQPGVLAGIAGVLGGQGISIASVVQKGRGQGESVPIVMLTHEAQEKAVLAALERIDAMDAVTDETILIRIVELGGLEGEF